MKNAKRVKGVPETTGCLIHFTFYILHFSLSHSSRPLEKAPNEPEFVNRPTNALAAWWFGILVSPGRDVNRLRTTIPYKF